MTNKISNKFEENLKELEEIVSEIEKGNLNLEDCIAKFESGAKLYKSCKKYLAVAEKKISILRDEMQENL